MLEVHSCFISPGISGVEKKVRESQRLREAASSSQAMEVETN